MNIDWKKWTSVAVLAFLICVILIRCEEGKADTLFELMPSTSFIAGSHYEGAGVAMHERFSGRYDVGVTLMTAQTCDCDRGDAPGNMGFQAQRIFSWRSFELGLGGAYWHNQTPAWNSNTTFALHIGFDFGQWTIKHRHYSTGGSSERNGGLDMLVFGYRFE